MLWRIEFANQQITDDDATVGEYATVNQIVNRPGWDLMQPDISPDVLGAWCIVCAMRGGVSLPDALLTINQIPVRQLVSFYKNTESEQPPTPESNGDFNPEAMQARIDALQAMTDQAKAGRESG